MSTASAARKREQLRVITTKGDSVDLSRPIVPGDSVYGADGTAVDTADIRSMD